MEVVTGDDGRARCGWGTSAPDYRDYHDTEWGFGVTDDHRLFEKLCLEGFQAGLSWLTILRKRDRFREVFAGFDPTVVATYGEDDVARLLDDAGIIRHQGKIRSTINNAARATELVDEFGSLAAFVWPRASFGPAPDTIPSTTPDSTALAKDLKRRGWSFVGPTTVYAFMQAMGLVNDHLAGCWVRDDAERARREAHDRVVGTGSTRGA
ncbi:DNA-3-methyladenine glycosylase I [Salsipaludibacter albus]|uniref:DNA-3-methyladenine glycosylase I n=1 Tax=Salsipaludibacter albus TaxID=2849650 RepID=UPI001EE3C445|nr:DNA-3-methyladenine glycosylase I [Salsipaludibacter albus]MBY5162736.1 DNA-3-methyladenine glycosylase I [Salsipaludibacter albus]